jgi:hypothetical protein
MLSITSVFSQEYQRSNAQASRHKKQILGTGHNSETIAQWPKEFNRITSLALR